MRVPIILSAALALLLSGSIVVIGAVSNYSGSQGIVQSDGIETPTPAESIQEWGWSARLAELFAETQTTTNMQAYDLLSFEPLWEVSTNGILTNGFCPGNMQEAGTDGDLRLTRLDCFDKNGKRIGYYEERWKIVRAQPRHELPIEVPSDWPWTPSRIEKERRQAEEDAASMGLPLCPGMYEPTMPVRNGAAPPCYMFDLFLSEEFVLNGKVLVFSGEEITERWVRQPCNAELCAGEQAWHTIDTQTLIDIKQYWVRYAAFCEAAVDFNRRLKIVSETDPELGWDPTVYARYSFDLSPNGLWMCGLSQLPPTEADWQPHVIWTP